MRPVRDPERAELNHLRAACDLNDKMVLEIGCGDGKFTRQYEGLPRSMAGIDPEISVLQDANKNKLTSKSNFIQAEGERLPFPSGVFDVVIFASSL